MTTTLYPLCQQVFPELTQVPYPAHAHDFHQFINWVNTLHSNIQYVELKEYYDNDTDKCYQLQQAQVEIEQLNNRIEAEVEQLFAEYAESAPEQQNEIDFAEHTMPFYLTISMPLQNNMVWPCY